jgi:drug/metabolite transporter (DMT)-like permease
MQQLGVIFALLCAVAWAFWGIFGKLSTNRGVPPATLAFLRRFPQGENDQHF